MKTDSAANVAYRDSERTCLSRMPNRGPAHRRRFGVVLAHHTDHGWDQFLKNVNTPPNRFQTTTASMRYASMENLIPPVFDSPEQNMQIVSPLASPSSITCRFGGPCQRLIDQC